MKNFYSSFYLAFTFLTRLPLPFSKYIVYSEENMAKSTAFYPLIGLFYGIVSYLIYTGAQAVLLPADTTSIIITAVPYIINRFFHIDGLLDSLDGMLSDRSQEERLKIMKDSRTGTFAFAGGFLFLSARIALTEEILKTHMAVILLLLIPVLSRTFLTVSAYFGTYPRSAGLGKTIIGKIKLFTVITAFILYLVITGLICFFIKINIIFLFFMVICSAAWMVIFQFYCYKKIGGITGDTLGAMCETTELTGLICGLLWLLKGINYVK